MTTPNEPHTNEVNTLVTLITNYSPSEADVVRTLNLLKLFFESYYFIENTTKTFESTVAQLANSENVTEMDLELLHKVFKGHLPYFSRETFYQGLDALEKALNALPRAVIHTPVRLDHPSLQRIATWMRSNISHELILSIRLNPLLIAGCGVSWNNRYLEISVDQKFQEKKSYLYSLLPAI